MLTMKAAHAVLEIDPACGGALSGWTRNGVPILHPVTDPNLIAQRGRAVAAYPLIPFSNRVGYGRFSFEGQSYELAENFGGEPHTIHGNAWMREWTVDAHDDLRTILSLEHDPARDGAAEWPFHYLARIEYAFRSDGLSVRIHVENKDGKDQPIGLGFHPFFPRTEDVELGFSAQSVWIAGENALPERRVLVADDPDFRFQTMRAVDGPALDNCFSGWNRHAFLRWPSRELALTIRADQPFDHLVVFTPPGRDYLAVEPASNMTDAINRPDIPDRGLVVLKPGETLASTIDFSLTGL